MCHPTFVPFYLMTCASEKPKLSDLERNKCLSMQVLPRRRREILLLFETMKQSKLLEISYGPLMITFMTFFFFGGGGGKRHVGPPFRGFGWCYGRIAPPPGSASGRQVSGVESTRNKPD